MRKKALFIISLFVLFFVGCSKASVLTSEDVLIELINVSGEDTNGNGEFYFSIHDPINIMLYCINRLYSAIS